MLCITPESFDAVDMIVRRAIDHVYAMLNAPMDAEARERIIDVKRIRIIHRTLAGTGFDVRQQFRRRDVVDHCCIHSAIAFQQPQHDAFAGGAASPVPFPVSAEITLVDLNLAAQTLAFLFCSVRDCLAQLSIDAHYRRIRDAKFLRDAISRLHLVKSADDCNLASQLLQAFLTSTMVAFYITAVRSARRIRTAKNALSSSQKIGRTTQLTRFSNNHKVCKLPNGYDSI